MSKFINPFTDIGFKKIFGQSITKNLLIDFLNDLLKGERVINDITVLDKEQMPVYDGDRGLIYDIYCTTDTGEKIIVEMQNKYQDRFKERSLYYLSQAVVRQGERGARWQYDIKAVYGVFFMNFYLGTDRGRFRKDIILADKETHELFIDKMRFIFLELPSFTKEEEECANDFERWIYVLKNMETLKRMPFKAQKSVFDELEKIVDISALSKEDRMKYDESIKIYRDNLAIASGQRKLGQKEGFEKGLEKGLKKGKEETLRQIALNMKSMGIPSEQIMQATGLSLDEINSL